MNNNYSFIDYVQRYNDKLNGENVIFNLIIFEFMNNVSLYDFNLSAYLIRNIEAKNIKTVEELLCTEKGINCMSLNDLRIIPLKIIEYQYNQLSDYNKKLFLIKSLEN